MGWRIEEGEAALTRGRCTITAREKEKGRKKRSNPVLREG